MASGLPGEILVLPGNAQHTAKLLRDAPRRLYARLHHVFGAVGGFAHTPTGDLASPLDLAVSCHLLPPENVHDWRRASPPLTL